eukprot:EG_transcript_58192
MESEEDSGPHGILHRQGLAVWGGRLQQIEGGTQPPDNGARLPTPILGSQRSCRWLAAWAPLLQPHQLVMLQHPSGRHRPLRCNSTHRNGHVIPHNCIVRHIINSLRLSAKRMPQSN